MEGLRCKGGMGPHCDPRGASDAIGREANGGGLASAARKKYGGGRGAAASKKYEV